MTTTNPDLPQATAAEEAEIRALLIDQGSIEDDAPAAEASAPAEDSPFDSPEEAAAAAEMAAEGDDAGEDPPPAEETEEEKVARLRADSSLARRERAITEREKSAKEQISVAIAPLREENAKLRNVVDNIQKMVHGDPAALFKAFGRENLKEVAEQIYYALVPDEQLPAEVKARKATMGLESKLSQLQSSIQQAENQRRRIDAANNAKATIKAAIASVPDKYPHLQDEAKDDPESITSEVWTRIGKAVSEGRAERTTPDEQLLEMAYQEIEQETMKRIERARRVHARRLSPPATAPAPAGAKPNTPVPPRVQSAPNSKNARALTRPRAAPQTREQEIEAVTEAIRSGKAIM